MSLAIIGLYNYTKVGTRREYSQDMGQTTVETYQGPVSKINDLFDASVLSVQDGTVDKVTTGRENGLGVLELHYADGDATNDVNATVQNNTIWELVGQDLYKNLRSFGFAAGGDLAAAGVQRFNLDADQASLENARGYFESAGNDPNFFAPAAEPAVTYLALLQRGVDQYVRSAVVLRSTITVSRRSLVAGRWVGVDRAWKLDGEDGSPNLDSVGQSAIIGSINEMPEADDTKKQWLKRAPQITMASRKAYTIAQEWWFARRWSHNLYLGDSEDGNP